MQAKTTSPPKYINRPGRPPLVLKSEKVASAPGSSRKKKMKVQVKIEKKKNPPAKKKDNYSQGLAPGFVSIMSPGQQVGTSVMIVDTVFDGNALDVAMATFFSNLLFRNVIGANSQNLIDIVKGLAYLESSIVTITSSGTAELTALPIVFDLVVALCREKKVKLGNGTIHYTPNWGLISPTLNLGFETPTGATFCLTPPGVNPLMAIDFNFLVGDSDDYAQFLRVVDDSSFGTWGSTIVKLGTVKGLALSDPSAYARNYTYFGSAGYNVGGFYSVSEIEAPFLYPMFSKFVKYDEDDKVISRVFHPQSGGIALPIGLSVSSHCDLSLMKNPLPCHYKFLDILQVYSVIMGWVVAVMDDLPGNLVSPNDGFFVKPSQFPFSQEDFLILLRQALLNYFPEQCHGQFVTPLAGASSLTNSVFQPLIVDTIGAPMACTQGMILPSFIVENLNMLKGRVVTVNNTPNAAKFGTVPKKLAHNFMPVWGTYSGDTPPSYQFSLEGVPTPVFNPTSIIPNNPQLWDCVSRTSPTNKVNINLYVGDLLITWNNFCTGFAKSRTTKLSPLSGDVNAKVNLLSYTRVIEKIDVNADSVVKNYYAQPIDKFIINGPSSKRELPRTKSEKTVKIKVIPPATYNELKVSTVTSIHSLSQNVVGALNYFILPSIRLNVSGVPQEDLLTLTAYQTVTGELCQSSNVNSNGAINVANETERTTSAGILFHAGFASGDADNDTLTSAVNVLSEHGSGIDFLKSLFGGLASIIPVVGPVVSGLINSM